MDPEDAKNNDTRTEDKRQDEKNQFKRAVRRSLMDTERAKEIDQGREGKHTFTRAANASTMDPEGAKKHNKGQEEKEKDKAEKKRKHAPTAGRWKQANINSRDVRGATRCGFATAHASWRGGKITRCGAKRIERREASNIQGYYDLELRLERMYGMCL
eukprot:CAMPEP_0181383816 /NCGR_PEP_ID=MMETSP1106-20121128/21586_1 /TAXON_ID=81844 /ORGANISM="Mantoniella antarctica, Strain SL-175" /LENGTH=157 /DNA_ID=CAMNT_0023503551 /DNA_START=236 /DNA_END=710 /DNA_ORIENTATION=-